jgi:hypothetical protein
MCNSYKEVSLDNGICRTTPCLLQHKTKPPEERSFSGGSFCEVLNLWFEAKL